MVILTLNNDCVCVNAYLLINSNQKIYELKDLGILPTQKNKIPKCIYNIYISIGSVSPKRSV